MNNNELLYIYIYIIIMDNLVGGRGNRCNSLKNFIKTIKIACNILRTYHIFM